MRKWEDDLQALMRKPPGKEVMGTIITVMQGRSDDRAAALTCGALAEAGLVAGIAYVLQPSAQEILKHFWNYGGQYSTFHKKITGAATMGLIGPVTKHNLNAIRNIRNVFAHSMADVRFTTPEIVTACEEITLSKNAAFFVERRRARKSRYRYCFACDEVFRKLVEYAAHRWIFGMPPHNPGTKPAKPLLP